MAVNLSYGDLPLFNESQSCLNGLMNHSTDCNHSISSFTTTDDYYYDYDYSTSYIPMSELLPVTVTYGITLLIGIVGNFLVIFAVSRYKRLRSITNTFLTSLATADLLLLLVCVPIKCAAFMSFTWSFGEFLCKFVNYMQTVSMICSVMTLTVMSMERWVAILYPLKAKYLCTYSHARLVLLIVWTLSFIMATPILVGQKHVAVGVKIRAYWCVKSWASSTAEIAYEVYMLVLMFVIPMTVMIAAYTGICKELLHVSSTRVALRVSSGRPDNKDSRSGGGTIAPLYKKPDVIGAENESKRNRNDDDKTIKVIQMLIVVVVLFSVCWGPILINNVLIAVGAIERLHYDYLKPMRQAFFLMSYINSCSNPVVYGFMSRHFRESFKRTVLFCFCGSQKRQFHQIRYSLNASRSTNLTKNNHVKANRPSTCVRSHRNDQPSPLMSRKSHTGNP